MKNVKAAFWGNIVTFILAAFSTVWAISGISSGVLANGSSLYRLRYYTVDSNILMGLAALASAIEQRQILRCQRTALSPGCRLLKLAGTVSITLTMLITAFFLGPTMGRVYGFFSLYQNSNFFLHLVNPLAAIVVFLWFEKTTQLRFSHTLIGVLPTLLYAVFYIAVTLQHITSGKIEAGYDWYGFFAFGIHTWPLVVLLILLFTWGISLALWLLNRRGAPDD